MNPADGRLDQINSSLTQRDTVQNEIHNTNSEHQHSQARPLPSIVRKKVLNLM